MTAVTDNFNRANETPLASPWTKAAASGTFNLASNALSHTATGDTLYWYAGAASSGDQYAQAKVPVQVPSNDWGPGVRCQAGGGGIGTFYGYEEYSGFSFPILNKVINGTFTGLNSTGPSPGWTGATDVLRMEISGTTINCYRNGTLRVGPITDSSITGGQPGIFWYEQGGTLDDFAGGDLGTAISGTDTGTDTEAQSLVARPIGTDAGVDSESGSAVEKTGPNGSHQNEDFNRADGEASLTSFGWATPFFDGDAHLTVAGNALAAVGASWSSAYLTAAYGPNCEIWVDVPIIPATSMEFFLRGVPGGGTGNANVRGYLLDISGSAWGIYKIAASNIQTQIGTNATQAVSAGDSVGFSASGTTLKGWYRPKGSTTWTQVLSVTDATYSSAGNAGVVINGSAGRLDNLGVATLSGTPISGTDTGTDSETQSLLAKPAGTDTATDTETASQTAVIPATDTATDTETVSQTAVIPGSDTGTETEATSLRLAGTDTGTETEAQTLVARPSVTDLGSDTESAVIGNTPISAFDANGALTESATKITSGAGLGTQAVGAQTVSVVPNDVYAAQFSIAADQFSDKAWVWAQGADVDTGIRIVIYKIVGGLPTTLVAASNELVIPGNGPMAQREVSFPSRVYLPAGTYAVGFHGYSGGGGFFFVKILWDFGGSGRYAADTYADGTNTTWTGDHGTDVLLPSIFIPALPVTSATDVDANAPTTEAAIIHPVISGSDTATDSEFATTATPVAASDVSTHTEVATPTAQAASIDQGSDNELGTPKAVVSGSESATGVDTGTAGSPVSGADTGTDSEAVSLVAQSSTSETATLVEIISSLIRLAPADSGTIVEAVLQAVALAGTQTATASEIIANAAQFILQDAGVISESGKAAHVASDTFGISETASVSFVGKLIQPGAPKLLLDTEIPSNTVDVKIPSGKMMGTSRRETVVLGTGNSGSSLLDAEVD